MGKPKLRYQGRVDEKGALRIFARQDMLRRVRDAFPGKDVEVIIREKKGGLEQNDRGYYWGVVLPILREGFMDVGEYMTNEEVHEWLKRNFLYRERVDEETGEIYREPLSVGELGDTERVEFDEIMDRLKHWASEYLDIYIPDRGEQVNLSFDKD